MAEWSIAAVLKTVDLKGFGGSNPSLSAKPTKPDERQFIRFFTEHSRQACLSEHVQKKPKGTLVPVSWVLLRPRRGARDAQSESLSFF